MRRLFLAFLSTGIIQLTNFASGIALARLLGPALRGEVAQIIAWFGLIASVTMMGVNDGVAFFRSRDPATSGGVLYAALACLLPFAAIGLALCSVVILLMLGDLSPVSRLAAWAFLLFVPLYQLQQVLFSYLQAGTKAGVWTIVRCIQGIVYILGLLAIAILGIADSLTVIFANLLGLSTCVVIGFVFAFRAGARLNRTDTLSSHTLLRYSTPLVFQKVAAACRDNLDKIILSMVLAPAILGHYVVAASVAYLIYIVGLTIDLVGFPAMTRVKDDTIRRAMAEFLISATFWVLVATVLILVPLREPVIRILFGPEFLQLASLVPYFLVAGALQALRMVIAGAFKAFDKGRVLAGVEIVNAVVMVVALVSCLSRFGVFAGVLAHLASSLVAAIIAIALAIRVLGLSPTNMLLPRRSDIARTSTQFVELLAKFRKRA
jgi:O-antigen/teichoic acid export membrane protein